MGVRTKEKGRHPFGHRPFRRRRLLRSGLQLAACADLDAVTGGDLDGLTRRRVATGASGAVGALDREPARDGHLDVVADRLCEGVEESVENGVHRSLALARLSGNSRDELGTV